MTQPQEIIFDPKIKNLGFLGEIFQTQTKDGWPNLSNKKLTRPDPVFLCPLPLCGCHSTFASPGEAYRKIVLSLL